MDRKLLVINGHPDPRPERFCAALCDAYAAGARAGGWSVGTVTAGTLPIPASDRGDIAESNRSELAAVSARIHESDRVTVVFPLWLDRPPIGLRQLFEFAAQDRRCSPSSDYSSAAVNARIVITMNMPSFMYRSRDCRGTARADAADTLHLPGVALDGVTLIGCVDIISSEQRQAWLAAMLRMGAEDRQEPSVLSRLRGGPRRRLAQNFL